jgi:hypothetical protein
LTQCEYVEFSLTKPANEKHEFHAIDVSGIKDGPILCETRRLSALVSRTTVEGSELEVSEDVKAAAPAAPVASAVALVRKSRPRTSAPTNKTNLVTDSEGFTQVKKRTSPRAKKALA